MMNHYNHLEACLARAWHLLPLALVGLYLLLVHHLMGLRPEHLLMAALILSTGLAHPKSRQWLIDFLPFILFAVLYDFLRVYPKDWAGPIQVEWPHRMELAFFGFLGFLPTDFFRTHQYTFLDLVTGVAYSLHMVIPLAFAHYAWMRDREIARQFASNFLLVNFFAFATYILFPAAPPWYVEIYGLTPADWSTPGSAAGLIGFDQILGRPYFEKVYGATAWVFGAIPSMHAGFPLLTALYARKIFRRGFVFFYAFMLLVWFAAVYLRHHYVIDLLAGAVYVLASYALVSRLAETKYLKSRGLWTRDTFAS